MANKNTIDIRVDGISELEKSFAKLESEGRKRVARQINVNAIEFQKEVRKSIRKPLTRGRRYSKHKMQGRKRVTIKPRRDHFASTRGNAPNSDTGNLVKLIMVTRKANPLKSRMGAYIISGAKYSSALEFGKLNRPFMLPMIKKKRDLFVGRIKKAITGLL